MFFSRGGRFCPSSLSSCTVSSAPLYRRRDIATSQLSSQPRSRGPNGGFSGTHQPFSRSHGRVCTPPIPCGTTLHVHAVCSPVQQLRSRGGPFVCNCSTLLVRRAAADTLRAHFDVTQIPGVSRRRIHQIQSPSDASRSSKVLVQGSMSVCSTVSSSSSLRCSRLMICVVEYRISIQAQ